MVNHDRFGLFRPTTNEKGEVIHPEWSTLKDVHLDVSILTKRNHLELRSLIVEYTMREREYQILKLCRSCASCVGMYIIAHVKSAYLKTEAFSIDHGDPSEAHCLKVSALSASAAS